MFDVKKIRPVGYLDGSKGGLIEYLINDPKKDAIKRISEINPEL